MAKKIHLLYRDLCFSKISYRKRREVLKLDMQMRIAANLRTLRTSKRLSQEEIASFIGISRSLYTHYELGHRPQDAEALYIISTRLGIDMTAFFENDPQKFLSYLASNAYQDEEMTELINIYRRLSPFSKGMLIEKAFSLLEKEKDKDKNKSHLFE